MPKNKPGEPKKTTNEILNDCIGAMEDMVLRLVLNGFPESCQFWSYEIIKKSVKLLEEKYKIESSMVATGLGLVFAKPEERQKFLKG